MTRTNSMIACTLVAMLSCTVSHIMAQTELSYFASYGRSTYLADKRSIKYNFGHSFSLGLAGSYEKEKFGLMSMLYFAKIGPENNKSFYPSSQIVLSTFLFRKLNDRFRIGGGMYAGLNYESSKLFGNINNPFVGIGDIGLTSLLECKFLPRFNLSFIFRNTISLSPMNKNQPGLGYPNGVKYGPVQNYYLDLGFKHVFKTFPAKS